MKKILIACSLFSVVLAKPAMAHIWRVNNDPAKVADFTNIAEAVATAAPGDTIHIEPSRTPYNSFVLNKRLVILGNGYFLGSGLQVDRDSSVVRGVSIDSSAVNGNGSGSFIAGIFFAGSVSLLHNVRNVTITRCLLTTQLSFTAYDRAADGISITKCFLEANVGESTLSATVTVNFENNIFSAATGTGGGSTNLGNNVTGLFRNNTINSDPVAFNMNNFYIANNVFAGSSLTSVNAGNNIVRNNTFASPAIAGLTDGQDGNRLGIAMAPLFTGSLTGGYGDARFQTVSPGILRGSGETIGGITPDRGAYNTVAATDSYRTSGIPAIPTIYTLTVPASISPTATTMDITVSTRSNN